MKKFIGILLVCLMLVGLMAACGEGDNTGNESTPATSSQSGGNQNNGGNQQVDVNVGCSGTVGFGALAIVALAGVFLIGSAVA